MPLVKHCLDELSVSLDHGCGDAVANVDSICAGFMYDMMYDRRGRILMRMNAFARVWSARVNHS